MNARALLFSLIFFPMPLLAFSCYLTVAKDNCWTNYNVEVTALDVSSNKPLVKVEVKKGKSWARQAFNCEPGQRLLYRATFNPSFWQSEAGKVYSAQRFWTLPATVKEKEIAWDIPVCFSEAFAEVPLPPDTMGNCQCNFNEIPSLKEH